MTHTPPLDTRSPENPAAETSRPETTSCFKKPALPDTMLAKWQRVVNLMSKILKARAALIVKLDSPQTEIVAASTTGGNPFRTGLKTGLNTGLYCEKVMSLRRPLLVKNASAAPQWHGSPQLALGMTFYVGYPLLWPGGEVFGTICVMDDKENVTAIANQDLVFQFKEVVEADLLLLAEISGKRKTEETLRDRERMLRAILDASPVGIALVKDRTINWANKSLHSILRYDEGALVEKNTMGLYPDRHEYDRVGAALYPMIQETGFAQMETRFAAKDGRPIRCDLRARALDVFDLSKGIIIAAMDLTERKRPKRNLRHWPINF